MNYEKKGMVFLVGKEKGTSLSCYDCHSFIMMIYDYDVAARVSYSFPITLHFWIYEDTKMLYDD
jgi:hypothetical protein